MKTLPSKKLLSEVLKNETKGLKSFGLSECAKYIIFQYEDFDDSINIYELAHKCKEWILINKYKIFIYSDDNSEWYCQVQLVDADEQPKEWSVAETEPEAIFKACEWILEQIR